ncbi:MAG: TonB-dependent receptor [Bacteroidales bacterium]
MKHVFLTLKRTILPILAGLFVCIGAFAQQITVKGIVKDTAGEPIVGANILEKGTTNGVSSDIDGKFQFEAKNGSTIQVSFIGYLTQDVTASTKPLVIVLQDDAIELEAAVVIGYGTVKKADATGSVIAIKPDKMNRGLTTNAQDMISGKIAGVNVTSSGGAPGAGATIRIRGGSSLSASNDPLIVIDGLAMDNDGIKGVSNFLSTVNPNDIESFTVLKDASATAIYGSRASNGVIIITTKKGQAGSRPTVSYDGNFSVSTKTNGIEVLTGDEFRALAQSMYSDQPDVISKLGTANTDWQNEIFRTAFGTDHTVTVAGGLKNMPYRASLGYTNQDGILKTSNFERYTASFNVSPTFFDNHLIVNLNGKGMITNNRFADTGAIGAALTMDPTQSVFDSRPEYETFGGYFQWYGTDKDTGNQTYNNLATGNPVALLDLKNEKSNAKSFIGNAQFDYKFHFLPELKANLNLGLDVSNGKQNLYVPAIAASDHLYGRTGYDKQHKTNKSLDFYLQYMKEFNNQTLDVMAGYAWQHFYRSGDSYYEGVVDQFNPRANEWKTESYLVSFFGRVNYNLMGRYLLTATLREDGTSRFSKDNRWGLFPSVALGWKVNEEAFMKDLKVVSDLKLRLGYGVTGQQNLNQGDYPYIPSYVINKDGAYYPIGGDFLPTYRPNAYNKNLKWEETTTYNAGIDFGFLQNRITGTVEVYSRETKDLLNMVDVSAGTNFKNRVISNIGSLENKGIEFAINAKPIVTDDLIWDVSYNVTYNKNKITKLTTGNTEGYVVATGGISQGTGNNAQAHAVGHAASSFYVYEQVYDPNGKPIEGLFVDRNGDGIINEKDKYFYEKPAGDVLMGFSSKLTYKGWDFGFSLRASIGNYIYNDVDADRANVGQASIWSTSGFFANRPRSAFETNFQGLTDYFMSDYYVQNGSFLRCDNITLGYTFKNLFNKGVVARVYGTVQNPFVITKYKGLDPEVSGGIDNNIYPRPLISLVGLSVSF